jgi:DNA-binding transcriptional regulator YdaS (Cro superfamily)
MDDLKAAVREAQRAAGNGSILADRLGLTRQAVYQWDKVPANHVLRVEEVTGIPRHKLRPDLYPEARELAAS